MILLFGKFDVQTKPRPNCCACLIHFKQPLFGNAMRIQDIEASTIRTSKLCSVSSFQA